MSIYYTNERVVMLPILSEGRKTARGRKPLVTSLRIRDLSSINCSPFNLVIVVPENSVSGKLMGGKKTLEEVAKRR